MLINCSHTLFFLNITRIPLEMLELIHNKNHKLNQILWHKDRRQPFGTLGVFVWKQSYMYNAQNQSQSLFCDNDNCVKFLKDPSTRTKVIAQKSLWLLQMDDEAKARPRTWYDCKIVAVIKNLWADICMIIYALYVIIQHGI